MNKRFRYVMLMLWSTCLACISYAASEPVHREFDPKHIEKYQNDSSYHYGEQVSFSFFEWLAEQLEKLIRLFTDRFDFGQPQPVQTGFLSVIVWIVAGLAVLGIIFILFRGKWSWVFSGKKFKKKKEEEYSVYDEDIHNINFTDEIELAVQGKNYRKATRLFYLKSLKLLSDEGIIDWKLNKTNTDYRWEIKDKAMRNEFDFLSNAFEYVWYGEFEPTEDTFLQTFDKFRSFNKRFQSTTTA